MNIITYIFVIMYIVTLGCTIYCVNKPQINKLKKGTQSKNKVHFYVARDKSDNTLYIYLGKPRRDISKFYPSAHGSIIAIQDYFSKFRLNEKDFDNLKFEDEPVEVFLNLED